MVSKKPHQIVLTVNEMVLYFLSENEDKNNVSVLI